jgi:hypothetical protein
MLEMQVRVGNVVFGFRLEYGVKILMFGYLL